MVTDEQQDLSTSPLPSGTGFIFIFKTQRACSTAELLCRLWAPSVTAAPASQAPVLVAPPLGTYRHQVTLGAFGPSSLSRFTLKVTPPDSWLSTSTFYSLMAPQAKSPEGTSLLNCRPEYPLTFLWNEVIIASDVTYPNLTPTPPSKTCSACHSPHFS